MCECDAKVNTFAAMNAKMEPRSSDPWKHRSAGMKCVTCMWFVAKVSPSPYPVKEEDYRGEVGRCRRHAPSMNGHPVVFSTDWCGDHKLDETKI